MEDTSLTHWQFITAKVLYKPYYMKTLIKETRNLSPRVHRRAGSLLLGDTLLCAAPRLRQKDGTKTTQEELFQSERKQRGWN